MMKILAIETSCDETAVAVVEASGDEKRAEFKVLGNALLSQIELHRQYGGVFPSLAKREHAKNLVPILEAALEEAELLHEDRQAIPAETRDKIAAILSREPDLCEPFLDFVSESERPEIDAIAVTAGPGLEPALWVGINFAKALSLIWEKPLIGVNHMEGHILAALAEQSGEKLSISNLQFPILALLISGGHTELVLMKNWLEYELVGKTRDDAVGETFDKVARMLALPYPGGPEISKLAELSRNSESVEDGLPQARRRRGESEVFQQKNERIRPQTDSEFNLPRPMLDSETCDFSFAGLKTAVLYLLKKRADLNEREKQHLAREFEDAVADVLWKKTAQALEETGARTLVVGGGVSANTHIRRTFREKMDSEFPDSNLRIPASSLTTDNAIMIALAAFYRAERGEYVRPLDKLEASGNLSLA